MNLFELSATIKLDTSEFSSGLSTAKLELSGVEEAINSATSSSSDAAGKLALFADTIEGVADGIRDATGASAGNLDDLDGTLDTASSSVRWASDELREFEAAAAGADTNTSKLSSTLGTMKGAAMVAIGNLGASAIRGAASAIGDFLEMGVDYNAQMETYTTNFTTMLGSESAAVQKVEDLKRMAASTPFSMGDLADATQTLLSFQVPAEKTDKILRQMGDVSLGNKTKLAGLATVFGQVSSAGKLTGQDLMQFINQGFNPLNYIAQDTGESMEELRERMSEGGVTAEEVEAAFEKATSAGGDFYNGMEAGSKTMSGQWSTLKDTASELAGTVMKPFSELATNTLLPAAQSALSAVSGAASDLIDALFPEESETDRIDQQYTDTMAAIDADQIDINTKIALLTTLSEKTHLTAAEQDEWRSIQASLAEELPGVNELIGDQVGVFASGAEAVQDYADSFIQSQREMAAQTALQEYQDNVAAQVKTLAELQIQYDTAAASVGVYADAQRDLIDQIAEASGLQADEVESMLRVGDTSGALENGLDKLGRTYGDAADEYNGYSDSIDDQISKQMDLADEISDQRATVDDAQTAYDMMAETMSRIFDDATGSADDAAGSVQTLGQALAGLPSIKDIQINIKTNGLPSVAPVIPHADGGIFSRPTLLGQHLVAEAGAEAILPLSALWDEMSTRMDRATRNSIDYDRLALAIESRPTNIVVDGYVMASTMADANQRALDERDLRYVRGKGGR